MLFTTDGLRAPETADKQVQNYSAAVIRESPSMCWYQMGVEAEFTRNTEHLRPSSLSGKSILSCTNKANTSPSTSQIATTPLWFPPLIGKVTWMHNHNVLRANSEKERAACRSLQIHAVKNQTRQHFTWNEWELWGCRETHIVAASWCNRSVRLRLLLIKHHKIKTHMPTSLCIVCPNNQILARLACIQQLPGRCSADWPAAEG